MDRARIEKKLELDGKPRIDDVTAEERYRSLVENLPASAVLLVDQDLRFILVDGPELKATGFSKAVMEGKTLHEVVPAEFAATVEPNLRRVLSGERFSAEIPFGDQHYHYEYVPILGAGDSVRFGLVLAQNVTERVRTEQERRRLEAQLQQAGKLDALGRLAGGVAHDFNNLLTAIHGYTSLLLRNSPSGTEAHADLLEIQRAAERGTTLTSQLLAFSRKHVTEPVLLDLNAAIAGALRLLHRLLGEHVEVIFEASTPLGRIHIDPGQLEQVLVNLAVNARDAMTGGGRLTISTRERVLDEAFCAARVNLTPGTFVHLAVKDTGAGVSKEILEHLFEPFFTTKSPSGGTGLGLSIVYGIVRGAGGFIEVSSAPGVGTAFDVYLPSHDAGPEEIRTPPVEAPPSVPLSVLLVEDEPAVLAVTARILRMHGHIVHEVVRVEDALAFAGDPAHTIDVLVTDVIMPRLEGTELHARLLADRPELPAVFVSGYTDAVISGPLADKRVHFVQKPFTPAQLLGMLERAVGRTPRS
ncbi:MAG: ATP-binding protein [Kofleriaceae bacterium]|nr:ATP-binding protein [Kofleriaceae bacterium]